MILNDRHLKLLQSPLFLCEKNQIIFQKKHLYSYVFFIPKINFTIPLNGLGTFFTTIVILLLLYFSKTFFIPIIINPIEIIHNHAVGGKKKKKNIPIPAPNMQPAIIFFNLHLFLKNIFITSSVYFMVLD